MRKKSDYTLRAQLPGKTDCIISRDINLLCSQRCTAIYARDMARTCIRKNDGESRVIIPAHARARFLSLRLAICARRVIRLCNVWWFFFYFYSILRDPRFIIEDDAKYAATGEVRAREGGGRDRRRKRLSAFWVGLSRRRVANFIKSSKTQGTKL